MDEQPKSKWGQRLRDYFGFRGFMVAYIVPILYFLGAAAITLGSIGMLLMNLSPSVDKFGKQSDNTLPMLMAIAALLIGNLLWRIACETMMLLPAIHERLKEILKKP